MKIHTNRMCGVLASLFAAFLLSTLVGCVTRNGAVYPPAEVVEKPVELAVFKNSRKVRKNGLTVVYLEGTPREIGLAHGKLLREEIIRANRSFLELFDNMSNEKKDRLLSAIHWLEERIPSVYLEEMHGIATGSGISYEKVLFLNSLTTLSGGESCFSFAVKDVEGNLLVFRHIDSSTPMYEDMVLFIIKPDFGNAFAALLNPGWIDGETGMNQAGLFIAQNNIRIRQNKWDVVPITILTRQILQNSSSIEDAFDVLEVQHEWPARLLFIADSARAVVVEMANERLDRIDMEGYQLAVANHPRRIPSDDISPNSERRLRYAEDYLIYNKYKMSVEKGIKLMRDARINSFYHNQFVNKQSVLFKPATGDFWIALRPEGEYTPASKGAFVGFNIQSELGVGSRKPEPEWISGE